MAQHAFEADPTNEAGDDVSALFSNAGGGAPAFGAPVGGSGLDSPDIARLFEGAQVSLSPEDQLLVQTLSMPQAVCGVLSEHYPDLAKGIAGGLYGLTVKQARAAASALVTALGPLDNGYVFGHFEPRDDLLKIPMRIFHAALATKHVMNEVFVLPSRVCSLALKHFAAATVSLPSLSTSGVLFNLGGAGNVVVPPRHQLTDAIVGRLLTILGSLTRIQFVTVSLEVERLLTSVLSLAPMRLVAVPGGGMKFEEVNPASKELRTFREKFVSAAFQTGGILHARVSNIIDAIRKKLNTIRVPTGVSKEPLLQACWHVHRCGSPVRDPIAKIAGLFFQTFGPTLAQVEKSFEARLAKISTWSYKDIPSEDKFSKEDIKFSVPLVALHNLYEDRRLRSVLGLDKLCESLTMNDLHCDKAMSVAAKIQAVLTTCPLPPQASVAVLGEDKGYDVKLYPKGTHFFDLLGKVIDGNVFVEQLDVNNAARLSEVFSAHTAVFSDVCPDLENANINLKELSAQCAYGKNLTILQNLCRAAMSAPNLEWFGFKMFLPPTKIMEIPPYLVALMHRWGYFIVKSGKLHSDEFYVIFSNSAPKRFRGYWHTQMLRIGHIVELGHEISMKGMVTGSLALYRTPEAAVGWESISGERFPYASARGIGYKDSVVTEDYQEQLALLWGKDEFDGVGAVPVPGTDNDPSTILFPPSAAGSVPDHLVDRRPAGVRREAVSTAALAASNARAGVESAWSVDPPPQPLVPPAPVVSGARPVEPIDASASARPGAAPAAPAGEAKRPP
jgi:hypothetical protein